METVSVEKTTHVYTHAHTSTCNETSSQHDSIGSIGSTDLAGIAERLIRSRMMSVCGEIRLVQITLVYISRNTANNVTKQVSTLARATTT